MRFIERTFRFAIIIALAATIRNRTAAIDVNLACGTLRLLWGDALFQRHVSVFVGFASHYHGESVAGTIINVEEIGGIGDFAEERAIP